uniref:Uncharacterized protein n=1 Tax=Ditylenchus dipsaci TaxID=166011 RepID=A0A915CZ08_9BILA
MLPLLAMQLNGSCEAEQMDDEMLEILLQGSHLKQLVTIAAWLQLEIVMFFYAKASIDLGLTYIHAVIEKEVQEVKITNQSTNTSHAVQVVNYSVKDLLDKDNAFLTFFSRFKVQLVRDADVRTMVYVYDTVVLNCFFLVILFSWFNSSPLAHLNFDSASDAQTFYESF